MTVRGFCQDIMDIYESGDIEEALQTCYGLVTWLEEKRDSLKKDDNNQEVNK